MRNFSTIFILLLLLLPFYRAHADLPARLGKSKSSLLPAVSKSDEGRKGNIIITAGAGFNTLVASLILRYDLSSLQNDSADYDYSLATFSTTPIFHGIIDYGIGNKFTIGAGIGFQKGKVAGWEHNDYIGSTGYYVTNYYTDRWSRINMGVRGLFHILAKEKIALYTGLRLGMNIYSHKTNFPDSNYFTNLDVRPSTAAVQALFGFSFFPVEMIGVNTEVGVGYGGPYYYHIGASFKFGG